MSLTLAPRLKAAAELVGSARILADVGTDHAYLPVYLLLNGKIERAYCCDIGSGPLKNAAQTIEKYGLSDKAVTIESDGLEFVPDDADAIVIAGMGGELICDILAKKASVKRTGLRLVLQPMTHSQQVRRFLCENGFETLGELTVSDAGRNYLLILAEYTGVIQKVSESHCFFGKIKRESDSDRAYIDSQTAYARSRRDGLEKRRDFEGVRLYEEIIKFAEENL